MSLRERRVEDAVLGDQRRSQSNALAVNMGIRNAIGSFAIDLFERHRLEHPGRRYCLVSLVSDRWLSFDRQLVIWLGGMTAASRQVLRLGGFDGWLAVSEFQTLVETRAPLGRLILPNVHTLAWSDDPDFSFEDAEQRMASSQRLVSHISARTADVSFRADTCPTNLAAYMFKGACIGKRRILNEASPSGFAFADCSLPPRAAARQSELLSSMYINELIFAGGEGAAIRRSLMNELHRLTHSGRTAALSTERAIELWRHTRPCNRAHYYDVAICRDERQLPKDLDVHSLLDRTLNAGLRDGTVQRLLAIGASV